MPCNARVVIEAKVKIDVDDVLRRARELKTTIYAGDTKMVMIFGQATVEFDLQGNAVLRSNAPTWDEGVTQLRNLASWLTNEMGVKFEKMNQPETHRHDEVPPWQRVKA